MKHWLLLSFLIPEEFAEPASNFLMEKGATGIEEKGEGVKQIRLKAYFLRDGGERKGLRSLRRYLASLRKMNSSLPCIEIGTTSISEQNWGENWKKFFKPLRVGSRLIVKPPWTRIRLEKDEIPIEITPGMAFGTGTHGTTRLCMEALEKRLKKKNLSVLDAGTGSGILAIAAARLGAEDVLGIDIDALAVEIARENVGRNGVSQKVRIRKARIGEIRKKFDLVVANLDFKSLKRTRIALIRRLKEEGVLILSGILTEEESPLCQLYLRGGDLRRLQTAREGEWSCLTLEKK